MKYYLLNALKPSLLAAGAIAGVFTKYIFTDVEFLKWLFIAMIVDLVTGVTKVWVKEGHKAITSKGLRDTVAKFIQYGAFLIVTNILANFEVNGKVVAPLGFITDSAYVILILIEIKSVYENIVAMNPALDFLSKWIDRIGNVIAQDKSEPKS